jgi:putative nucleotide binding protein
MTDSESGDPEADAKMGVVLDFLRHGRTEDDRPQYEKSPLAYVLTEDDFELFEVEFTDDPDIAIADRVNVARDSDLPVGAIRDIDYDDLPGGARSELEYVVEDIVADNERRFVDFYNEAQPITLRLHQLNLLPGIGKKLRNDILDARDRRPFQSFEDLESRIDGLHSPRETLVERVIEELREDDLKYRTFVRTDEQD